MFDHVGFAVSDLARSRAFYVTALAPLGFGPVMLVGSERTGGYAGTGNGEPDLRPHCHPNYHDAFVFDMDGNNIETICHAPA